MSLDNKTQFQNFDFGGVGALHDPSWLDDHAPKRPHTVESAGFQVNRFAKFESYDIETREPTIELDEENDPKIGIIEPLNFIWLLHEYNTKEDTLRNPDQFLDVDPQDVFGVSLEDFLRDLAGKPDEKPEEKKGRVRPHSKLFAFGTINDAKHLVGSRLNRSTVETRYEDYRTGRRHQIDLVRECLTPEGELSVEEIEDHFDAIRQAAIDAAASGGDYNTASAEQLAPKNKLPRDDATALDPEFWPSDRIMTMINNGFEQYGGYVCQSQMPYINRIIHEDNPQKPPRVNYAQWGDLFVCTEDDIYAYTQRDNNARTLLNIWTKGHFHKDEPHDGPLDMVDPFAPEKSTGLLISGDLRILQSRANADPSWGMESGKWVPVVGIPNPYMVPVWEDGGVCYSLGGFTIPAAMETSYCAGYLTYPHNAARRAQYQNYVIPRVLVDAATAPASMQLLFATRIPAGEIMIDNNAVFRFGIAVHKDGDNPRIPSIVRYGVVDVPIDMSSDFRLTVQSDASFHLDELSGTDMISVWIQRDYDHARDTANYEVYLKEAAIKVMQNVPFGHYGNDYYGADYPYVA